MKKSVYVVLLLTIIVSYQSFRGERNISGHWYSCAKNGNYVELHFKNNLYKYSTDFGLETEWNEFEIKGDTIIQYDNFLFEDSIVINRAIFKLGDSNELKLEYLSSDETWIFSKIEGEIGNTEDNLVLRNETIERSKQRTCIDYRTKKEIKNDYLDSLIDFKF